MALGVVRRISATSGTVRRRGGLVLDTSSVADTHSLRPERTPARKARAGYFSIRIDDQYRIVFRFERSDARDVQIVDYH
jgi:plasmid maintenance system killer protein